MKISDEMRYPHPVLSEVTGDYLEGQFDMSFQVLERPEKATLALEYSISLNQPEIEELVTKGDAAIGVYVACLDTYYFDLVRLSSSGTRIEFGAGKLSGRVIIRPLIWALTDIEGFISGSTHEEFGADPLSFPPASLLAIGAEVVINVGREKLRELETIFAISKKDDLAPGTFNLKLDTEKITVLVAQDIYDLVNKLRLVGYGRSITLNSVFLPAVMETLSSLRGDPGAYETRRWYRIFMSKCEFLDIDIENDELWPAAQKLLDTPFHQVQKQPEFLEG